MIAAKAIHALFKAKGADQISNIQIKIQNQQEMHWDYLKGLLNESGLLNAL